MKIKLLYILLLSQTFIFSQKIKTSSLNVSNKPIIEVLQLIETHYKVKFSYEDILLHHISISINLKNKSLSETIIALNNKTNLIFKPISKRYITISSPLKSNSISICGRVLSTTKDILSGATILYKGTGKITNKNGYFFIDNMTEQSLIKINYLGFKSVVIKAKTLDTLPCKTIYLNEKKENLKNVEITKFLTKGISKKTDGSFLILPKKLGILPGLTEPDIFQSLQLLPGISSPNETATGLHVNGGTPDQNLILWEGIKVYHKGHLFGEISAFNPYISKKIIFFNKGTNPKYDDRISSVIDISTSNRVPKKIKGGFGFNLIETDAFLNIPILKNKFSIQISGRRSYTDLLKSYTYKRLSNHAFQNTTISNTSNVKDKFFFYDYNIKALWKFSSSNYISITHLKIENNLNFELGEKDSISTIFDNTLNTKNTGYSINWHKKWNNKISQTINGNISKYELFYNKFTEFNESTINRFIKLNRVYDSGLGFNLKNNISTTKTLSGGYQYSLKYVGYAFLNIDPNQVSNLDVKENYLTSNSIYGSYSYNNYRKLNFFSGFRLNHYTLVNKLFFEPRIRIGIYLSKHLKYTITGEFKTQVINQINETINSGIGLENQLWSLADKTRFPVITGTQLTSGLLYSTNNFTISAYIYTKKIKGVTTLNNGFGDIIDNDYHKGKSHILGINFYLKKTYRHYKTWISYSYNSTKTKFSGLNNNQYFTGNFNILNNFYWSHAYTFKNFNFALGWRWQSGQPYTKATGIKVINGKTEIVNDGINKYHLPNYNRLDISSTYNFKFLKHPLINGKIGLSFLNLLNTKNILTRNYFENPINNKIETIDKISLKSIPNFVFRLSW